MAGGQRAERGSLPPKGTFLGPAPVPWKPRCLEWNKRKRKWGRGLGEETGKAATHLWSLRWYFRSLMRFGQVARRCRYSCFPALSTRSVDA